MEYWEPRITQPVLLTSLWTSEDSLVTSAVGREMEVISTNACSRTESDFFNLSLFTAKQKPVCTFGRNREEMNASGGRLCVTASGMKQSRLVIVTAQVTSTPSRTRKQDHLQITANTLHTIQ